MMSIYRQAKVFIQGRIAGILAETENGYQFAYDRTYLESKNPLAVSLTLPLTQTPYEQKTLFAFFDGLIPEGWMLNVVQKRWGIVQNDRFGVLLKACHDCIGDVQIFAIEESE
ncbi:HipA N-terminal domain-containing protein [bacterium]|nr:HipA N-terminal domain-containing protein [bacterium]